MAQGWYVSVDGKTTGPFSTEQVIEDVKQNRISREATVCATGLTRFHKITDEPELAKAFATAASPTVLPQVCGVGARASGRCCPMPRIVAATTLLLSGAFWSTAAVGATHACGTAPARIHCLGLGIGLSALAAVVTLFVVAGIVRRRPAAHCGASMLHMAGLIGSVALAKLVCPMLLVVTGVHVLGLLSTCGARRQACRAQTPVATV